jgi:hypothetical protein
MAFVFRRGLGLPLGAIVCFAVALTAPPPAPPFLMLPTTLFIIAAVGIAGIAFSKAGAIPWLRTPRALVRVRRSGPRDHATAPIIVAAGTCVRTLDEPSRSEADDALDLVRMDDDGGWQMPRPPA